MIIDGAVITNGSQGSSFIIENKVPLLRQPDIINEEGANTPCRRIYLAVQLMYIDMENKAIHYAAYWDLAQNLVKAAPSMAGFVDEISEYIQSDKYYQALKLAKKMINYEHELLSRV